MSLSLLYIHVYIRLVWASSEAWNRDAQCGSEARRWLPFAGTETPQGALVTGSTRLTAKQIEMNSG